MLANEKSKHLVSIVIVNWNGLEDTKFCLEHTRKQSYKDYEIIVVDNGSTDNSLAFLRKQKDILLVENPKNLGFTGGHIAGYKVAQGEFILLLNNDAVMDSNYVKRAVDNMLEDAEIGAVGGRAYLWDENNLLFDRTDRFYAYQNINPITAEGIFTQHDLGLKQSVNVVSGSCVMVRKKVIDEIGYLYNSYFAYYEESDLFARMKRAGYKIIYDPDLAIWHANAKSSSKKGSTFSFYMMMRNRYRFAVRNFDSWSLIRFLKFYLKMGVVSLIKSLLPLKQRAMHQAYARAFLYNLVLGWRPFIERGQLSKKHGSSTYNQLIVREQTGVSIVSTCESKARLDSLIELSRNLEPIDEVLAVTTDDSLTKYLQTTKYSPSSLRLCVDRGYLQTHRLNIGAVCARNDWLLLSGSADYKELFSEFKDFAEHLYAIKRSGKKLACLTDKEAGHLKFEDALSHSFSQELLISRDLYVDENGLDKELSVENGKRQIISYSIIAKKFFLIASSNVKTSLSAYSGKLGSRELHKRLEGRLNQATNEHRTPSLLDKVSARYYRVAQLRNLVSWFFYPRIPLRLKVGRTKNILLAALKLDRLSLAIELKHMRNEVMIYKNMLDVVALKEKELDRLDYVMNNPDDVPVFIILRDRYESLKPLLAWFEEQGLKKIFFIDNDSKLPPLVGFLERTKYQVLELGRNMRQTAPWSAGVIKLLVPNDFYIVTDPDILPTRKEKDVITKILKVHKKYPYHLKVGLGLKIDDIPDHYPLKEQVVKWESQFWKYELEQDIFEAPVDTTFAVYKPHTYKYLLNPSIRTGEPYVAQHLPWYSKPDDLSDEEVFYRLRLDEDVNTWNKEHLPDRYKKELSKQKN